MFQRLLTKKNDVFRYPRRFPEISEIFRYLKKQKVKYLRIDGSTKNRKDIVETFQKDKEHQVLLLSLKKIYFCFKRFLTKVTHFLFSIFLSRDWVSSLPKPVMRTWTPS